MPLPVLEREIGGMLQLARRSAPGTFNRSGADPAASTSLENETLSFAILISRRPTSISVAGQPTFKVTPRLRHHDIGLGSVSSGAVSPASTDDSSTRLYASRGSSPINIMLLVRATTLAERIRDAGCGDSQRRMREPYCNVFSGGRYRT
jgi:hypothetical protein